MVGCSSHHLTYLDANSLYDTAQSEPLPVDLHKVTTCMGRGHSVAASRTACYIYIWTASTAIWVLHHVRMRTKNLGVSIASEDSG